jgi:hypothetical protein
LIALDRAFLDGQVSARLWSLLERLAVWIDQEAANLVRYLSERAR